MLESYGYKTIELNKFNIGKDQPQTINDLLSRALEEFEESGDNLIKKVLEDSAAAHEGLLTGTYKHCKRCDQNKPIDQFERPGTTRGYGNYCHDCVNPPSSKRRRKNEKVEQLPRARRHVQTAKRASTLANTSTNQTSLANAGFAKAVKGYPIKNAEIIMLHI